MSGGTRQRRTLIGLVSIVVAALVASVAAGPAPAQPADPTLEVVDVFEPQLVGYVDCDGAVATDAFPWGGVLYELSEPAATALSIPVTFTGSLAADLVDPQATVEIFAGETWGDVFFEVGAVEAGELVVTLEPGAGYVLGEAATVTIEPRLDPEVVADCTEELTLDVPARADQTIRVGERPLPLGFFEDLGSEAEVTETTMVEGTATEVDDLLGAIAGDEGTAEVTAELDGITTPVANGTLPPGLTYVQDRWGGAATTTGTYEFDVRLCVEDAFYVGEETDEWEVVDDRPPTRALPNTICFGFVAVRVTVLPAAPARPGRPATPATPVRTTARFTG